MEFQSNKSLVDEFDNLQKIKKEIDDKLEKLRIELISTAKQKNTYIFFGTHKKCSIKEYEKVVYPENKDILIKKIKEKGLYEDVSSINYFKLSPKILKEQIDNEIIKLVKKEKDFRVSLISIRI